MHRSTPPLFKIAILPNSLLILLILWVKGRNGQPSVYTSLFEVTTTISNNNFKN